MPIYIAKAASGGGYKPSTYWPDTTRRVVINTDYAYGVDDACVEALNLNYSERTFHSVLASQAIDQENSLAPGFDWYVQKLFNAEHWSGHLDFSGEATALTTTGEIYSATDDQAGSYVGTAFGGGGYFEASIRYNPALIDTGDGWPAFFGLALEHPADDLSVQWTGQDPEYAHFTEPDFFEGLGGSGFYIGNDHEWYGIYGTTCGAGTFCNNALTYSNSQKPYPSGTDFTQFHRYGWLWVPATDTAQGYEKWFFDGVQVGNTVMWDKYNDEAPPPEGETWQFGIKDRQHLILILGTGLNQTHEIEYVDVWQNPATKDNLTQ